MAEDYGVSLKITADTSDLDKIPQKVEATRQEIEQPVAQTVKVDVEQPKPVKIEAKAEKIRIEVEDAEAKKRIEALTENEGVKRIRVVTEGGELAGRTGGKEIFEIEVDAEKAKQTIADLKADARINVTADTSAAESSITGFFGRIRNGITSVRRSISTVFAGFGMVTFAVMGVESLVNGFRKLHDKLTETSRAIAQMRWDSWVGGFNSAADAMIGRHQRIIALLKEEQDVANKAASLRTMETSQNRAQEDSARQQVREAALAGATDPRERQRLEDAFAEEDDRVARERFEADKKNRLRQLDKEESIYRSKEEGAREKLPEIDKAIADQENVIDIARKSIAGGGDKEKNEKYIDEAKKRIDALRNEKKAVEDLVESMKREADYRVKQAKIVEQSRAPVGGDALREARKKALEKNDRRDQEDFSRERTKAKDDEEFEDRMRFEQRRASAYGATETDLKAAENAQIEMLRDREREASEKAESAKKTLADELAKPAEERDEKTMARSREEIRENEDTAIQSRRRREDIEASADNRRATRIDSYFGDLAQRIVDSRPKDRLTAMGLSSGGSGDHTVREQADNVKLLVQLVEQQIAATKDINVNTTATYAP